MPSIPHLSRLALHRCLQRHGISRLADVRGEKPKRQKPKRYPIGFIHIDIAEAQMAEGKLYLFVGVDRNEQIRGDPTVDKADRKTAWEFLEHLLKPIPYRNQAYTHPMCFDMICNAHGIDYRLTKPDPPWTNGQVERMNPNIKEAEAD